MAFDLTIDFVGLSMYIPRYSTPGDSRTRVKELSIVMPDCRLRGDVDADPDGSDPPAYHAGYLLFDLADLGVVPQEIVTGMAVSLGVHRFDNEQVEFVGLSGPMDSVQLDFPNFKDFATLIRPMYNVLDGAPAEVLMRTVLRGGSFQSVGRDSVPWTINGGLSDSDVSATKQYSSYGKWTRRIDDSFVRITFSTLRGASRSNLLLRPANGTSVSLKIANLCCTNPLEWPELPLNTPELEDDDFRWFYHLMQVRDPDDSWRAIVERNALSGLPVPTRTSDEPSDPPMSDPFILFPPPYGNCFGVVYSADDF